MKRTDRCSTCRLPIAKTGIRNRMAEDILRLVPDIPCAHEGCNVKTSYDEMGKHNKVCEYQYTKCPLSSCAWSGKIMDVHSHLESNHADSIVDARGSQMRLLLNNPEGLRSDIHADIIMRTVTGKIFLIAFWVLRGYGTTNSIVGAIIYVGGKPPDDLKTRMTLTAPDCSLTCERKPWSLINDLTSVATCKLNLIIDWELALRAGKEPPQYSDSDHMGRTPQPESMNLVVDVEICDPELDVEETSENPSASVEFTYINGA